MADLLHVGAEFESYDDFKQALEQYCKTTKVNGEAVKFVHSSTKFIKNGTLPSNEQKRLQFTMKAERCNFAAKTSCEAAYKLTLHTKENGDSVLRLEKFHGAHNSHIAFVPYNPSLVPLPAAQSNQSSKEKLQSIMNKISNGIKNLPDEKCDRIAEIMVNLWVRTEKNATYKVDFTDYPSKNDAANRVDIVRVGSPRKKSDRQKANKYAVSAIVEIEDSDDENDGDDDGEDECKSDSEQSSENSASQSSEQSEQSDESSQSQQQQNPSQSVTKEGSFLADSESSNDSLLVNDNHTTAVVEEEPSERSSENAANESLVAKQSEEISGKGFDSNNNKNGKNNGSKSSDDSEDASIDDEHTNNVTENEPSKIEANCVVKKEPSEQSTEKVTNETLASEQSKESINKDSESSSDSEEESMNNDHTNATVEKEPLESEAHDSLVSKQGEQNNGIENSNSGIGNDKDNGSFGDVDVEVMEQEGHLSQTNDTSSATTQDKTNGLNKEEIEDFLGVLFLKPKDGPSKKRSNKDLELEEERPSKSLRLVENDEVISDEQ